MGRATKRFVVLVSARRLALLIVGSLGLSAAPVGAQPPARLSAPPTHPSRVLIEMHALDMLIIRTADLARQRSRNQQVRAFAVRLERDHAFVDRQVRSVARHLDIDMNPEDLPKVRSTVRAGRRDLASGGERPALNPIERLEEEADQLGQLQGAAFDRGFVRFMAEAHEMAVENLTRVEAVTIVVALRTMLSKVIPILRQHVALADWVERRLG
jgi:predicted outer membrane protein